MSIGKRELSTAVRRWATPAPPDYAVAASSLSGTLALERCEQVAAHVLKPLGGL